MEAGIVVELGVESGGECVETAQLTTVGITTHLDVHRAQTTFGEQDHAGTGAEDGHTVENGLADWGEESEFVEEAHLDGALTTRENEAVFRLLPVFQLAQLESLDS